jgi:hypothetical protein
MSTSEKADSAWAPLRIGVFRALWLAALISNIGSWMQTVGAQWLLVHQPHASLLVSLVQMPPALLLTLTFVLGAGSAFSTPAYLAPIAAWPYTGPSRTWCSSPTRRPDRCS